MEEQSAEESIATYSQIVQLVNLYTNAEEEYSVVTECLQAGV